MTRTIFRTFWLVTSFGSFGGVLTFTLRAIVSVRDIVTGIVVIVGKCQLFLLKVFSLLTDFEKMEEVLYPTVFLCINKTIT